MKFNKIISAVLLVSAVIGCKKDDTTTITPSLDGYLYISGEIPEYISGGREVTLEPKGVSHPDGKEITYKWTVSPTAPTACTTKVFNFTFSDTLQTCTIYCTASAEGYTSSSATKYATVVKGGFGENRSIQGIDFTATEHFSTSDTTTYYYATIGEQTWLLNNVAEGPSGKTYRNAEAMSNVFGRYYSYPEAVAICESLSNSEREWKLPSLEDWQTLETYIKGQPEHGNSVVAALMGNATFNNITMWEYWPSVGDITNATGFSAMPVGYTNVKTSLFDGISEYAVFWTSTEADKASEANAVYLICNQPGIYIGHLDKESFGASVRCIQKK